MNLSNHLVIPVTAFALLLTLSAPESFANSPQFRGPSGNGVYGEEMKVPIEWGADTNVKWKIDAKGRGWSSPVIWGDKVFITTAVEEKKEGESEEEVEQPNRRDRGNEGRGRGGGGGRDRDRSLNKVFTWEVHCLDRATGKTLWKEVAHQGKPSIPTHRSNTYASETPVTDGERLYVYFGMVGVFCYDLDGKLAWKKDLGSYEMTNGWGTASSLALHEEHLFVQVDSENDSFVTALKTADGSEAWRVKRPDEGSNWGSPVIWKNKERTELILGGNKVRSYEPATGKVNWELDMNGGRSSASPSGDLERLIVGTEERRARGGRQASGGRLCSVKVGASGDITPQEGETTSDGLHWLREKGGPAMASPLIYEDYLYVLERSNILNCYHVKTGEPVYSKTRVKGARAFWASPWAHDGHVYCLDDSGSTNVIEPGNDYKVLSSNKLDDQFWASAAVADGTLILRGVESIYCIGK